MPAFHLRASNLRRELGDFRPSDPTATSLTDEAILACWRDASEAIKALHVAIAFVDDQLANVSYGCDRGRTKTRCREGRAMFWRKKAVQPAPKLRSTAMKDYIVEKVLSRKDDAERQAGIVRTARQVFGRHGSETQVWDLLFAYARDAAMVSGIGFAIALREELGDELSDAEYADCYLCASMCLTIPFRQSIINQDLHHYLAGRFNTDVDMLVFDRPEVIADLKEGGSLRYGELNLHPQARLPYAFLYLLAQVIRHRREGHPTPYQYLDAMLFGDAMVVAALENAWKTRAKPMLSGWETAVIEVQIAGEDYGEDFWEDVSLPID